jgi:filamentous hemagglutinin family protein
MKKIIKLSCYLILVANTSSYADVTTDGTVGAIQHLSGQMTIPQSLGTTAGNNLFHSFQVFNINTGESATFTGSNSLQNVISRVTGGQISNINGLLKSEVGNANFYFINPAGVTFGANAIVDVPAAFHVSTASSWKFADGSEFSATHPSASTLTIAEPVSFGFLGASSGGIVLDGAQLSTRTGNLNLSAGKITIENNGGLNTESGNIFIKADSLKIDNATISSSSIAGNSGNISIETTGSIEMNRGYVGALTGDISIKAGFLAMDNAIITSFPSIFGSSGSITIETKGAIEMGRNSEVSTNYDSYDGNKGSAGNITIKTTSLKMDNSKISSSASSGNSGVLSIEATGAIEIDNGDVSTTVTELFSSDISRFDNAGNVVIKADSLKADNTIISSSSNGGNSGAISIETVGAIEIANRANVSEIGIFTNVTDDFHFNFSTFENAGNIAIKAASLKADSVLISSTSRAGYPGSVSIETADAIEMSRGGIYSRPDNSGLVSLVGFSRDIFIKAASLKMNETNISSGSITIDAFGTIDATNSSLSSSSSTKDIISIKAGSLKMDNTSIGFLTSSTDLLLDTGAIAIETIGNVELVNGATVSSTGSEQTIGHIGNINVSANNLIIDKQGSNHLTGISSAAFELGGARNADNITVNIKNSLYLLNGGVISSTTLSDTGNAGKVNVTAGNILIDGLGVTTNAIPHGYEYNPESQSYELQYVQLPRPISPGISSDNFFSTGHAGTVDVTANTLTMTNGGVISSDTLASGKASDVSVNASLITLEFPPKQLSSHKVKRAMSQ